MRRSEEGKSTLKTIFALALLAALVYCCFKTIPVYISNYELQDYIRSNTPFWLTQHASADAVLKNVVAKAQDLDLPLSADDVKVEMTGSRLSVALDYSVPIDLKVYTWPLHFTFTADSRSL